MRLRTALMKSKNLVTVRVMQAIGPQYAQDYITRFGFDPKLHPAYLTMGLGAGAATPLQMATAYSVFANGGYRIAPYLIEKITDSRGNTLSKARPAVAGANAERAIDPRNAFIMTTLLHDVVVYGTGARVQELKRKDLAGKTGTTNDNVDAWFCGYNPSLVGVAWIGYDQPKTLGNNETGGVAALPIWMSYMSKVLKSIPERVREAPEGVVQVRINAETGLRDDSSNVADWFLNEFTPRRSEDSLAPVSIPGVPAPAQSRDVRNQLF
jgi:penicillin-binding protein 1A